MASSKVELNDCELDTGSFSVCPEAADLRPRLGCCDHVIALTSKLECGSLSESAAGTGDEYLLGHVKLL